MLLYIYSSIQPWLNRPNFPFLFLSTQTHKDRIRILIMLVAKIPADTVEIMMVTSLSLWFLDSTAV